jgi:hypothetical protein
MYLLPQRVRTRRNLGIVMVPQNVIDRPRTPIQIVREPIPRTPPLPVESPVSAPGTGANYAGTPVPVGFPTNQFFVSNDGSVWEYSQAQGGWINTGTPYNVSAPSSSAALPAAGSSAASPASAAAPVVNITTPAQESTYQTILDWLGQSTLISSVPNWVLVLGAGLVALKISRGSESRR